MGLIQYGRFLQSILLELRSLLGDALYADLMSGSKDAHAIVRESRQNEAARQPQFQKSLQHLASQADSESPGQRTGSSMISPLFRTDSKSFSRNSVLKVKAFGLNIVRPKASFHQLYQFT
jgi:hypothetical protein